MDGHKVNCLCDKEMVLVESLSEMRLKQTSFYSKAKLMKTYKGKSCFAVVLFCFFNAWK